MFHPVQQWGQVTMEISDTVNCFGTALCVFSPSSKGAPGRFQTNRLMNTFLHDNGFLMKHFSTVGGPSRHSLGEISQKRASGANSMAPVPVTRSLMGRVSRTHTAGPPGHLVTLCPAIGHLIHGRRCSRQLHSQQIRSDGDRR